VGDNFGDGTQEDDPLVPVPSPSTDNALAVVPLAAQPPVAIVENINLINVLLKFMSS
jgi:hypothetical protein